MSYDNERSNEIGTHNIFLLEKLNFNGKFVAILLFATLSVSCDVTCSTPLSNSLSQWKLS